AGSTALQGPRCRRLIGTADVDFGRAAGAEQVDSEADENRAESDRDGELPQASDAVADLVREQNGMLGAQAERLTELVEQQKQLLEVERTKTAAAQEREKTATKDARHNKHLARWGL